MIGSITAPATARQVLEHSSNTSANTKSHQRRRLYSGVLRAGGLQAVMHLATPAA